ncbi:MAG: ribonuclease Z [Actinobacteria bacterium]|nr:ribonuclease Z [Actinomycetota bacterium]
MLVRLLGTGGWMPTDRRETACVYFRDGADVLVLDAGSGFRRLVTDPELLAGVERLHIVLSHFHLDHTAGLVCLPGLKHVPAREVWAPGRLVAGEPAEELVHRLLDPPFLAGDPGDVTRIFATAVHELSRDGEIGPFQVELRVQPLHNGSTLALKVNGELAYCTDTAYDEENVPFVRGARTLLHEAFWPGDSTDDVQHSAAGEAARIAAAAEAERLVLVHVSPLILDEEELVASARARFPNVEVGRDGLEL